jgi:hypothetical protein
VATGPVAPSGWRRFFVVSSFLAVAGAVGVSPLAPAGSPARAQTGGAARGKVDFGPLSRLGKLLSEKGVQYQSVLTVAVRNGGATRQTARLKLDYVAVRVTADIETVRKARVTVDREEPKPAGRFYAYLDGVTDGYNLVTFDEQQSKRQGRALRSDEVFGEFAALGVVGSLYFNESLTRGLADLRGGTEGANALASLGARGIVLSVDPDGADARYTLSLTREKTSLRFVVGKVGGRDVLKSASVEADVDGARVTITETLNADQPLRPADPKSAEVRRRFAALSGPFKDGTVSILP